MLDVLDTLLDLMRKGGVVMPALVAVACALAWGLAARFLTLRRGTRAELRALVEERLCEDALPAPPPRGILDSAVLRAVAEYHRGTAADLRPRLVDALYEWREALGRHEKLVRAMVMVAPLLGLLGTVTGMIETFTSLAEQAFHAKSGGIAGGIAEALLTTQAGLTVAVPGLVLGRLLDQRRHRLDMELSKLTDLLCARRRDET